MTIQTAPLTDLGSAAAALVEKLAQRRPDPIAPGVYFGMPDSIYHADEALGSGDMKRLSYSPADYWFESPLNPLHEIDSDPTPAQIFGKAVHMNVLEGRVKFERHYGACEFPGNIKAGKLEREAIAASGKIAIKREDYDRIQQAGATMRANPELANAFSGGYSEVSVFWDSGGIRKKARLDYVKPRATVDLKSIRNSRAINFVEACRRAIAEYRYDIQVAHYAEGREAMRRLIAQGAIHNPPGDDAWLQAVASNEHYAWVFVFWQAEGAPLTWATKISPANGILDVARTAIVRAEENYRSHMERFGRDTPWLIAEPIDELAIEDMPSWWARG